MGYVLSGNGLKVAGLIIGCMIMVLCMFSSILFGATKTSWQAAVESFKHYDESSADHVIIQTTRVPRAFIAAAVGASLAVAGALMQAITKNPLASPSVLGVNAGATFFVVFAITILSVSSLSSLMWISFLGAATGAVIVYVLGSLGRDGLSPLKIILAGSAVTAVFTSFTQSMLVLNQKGLSDVLFWLTGSIAGRSLDTLQAVLPYIILSLIAAFVIGREINLLLMGEDAAKGLGQRTLAIKLFAGIIIVLLAGSSVSVAGPIAFIGIIIPHIARFFVGNDYRWLVPYCAVLGAVLLLIADVGARFIIMPEEVPVGVMTAVLGTPFFIYIARRGAFKS